MVFIPQFIMGSNGMPRRYYSYLDQFQPMHAYSTVGTWVLGLGFIIMAWNLLKSLKSGVQAPDNPWGAITLEWKTTSPPPLENFVKVPAVEFGPYEFEKDNSWRN